MKVFTVFTKLTGGKAKVLSTLGSLAIAGAAMTATAPTAHAQVAFGVTVGPRYYAPAPRPVYVAPAYGAYGYGGYAPGAWDHRRAEDWRAREWRDHEYFEHHRDFDRGREYNGRGWR